MPNIGTCRLCLSTSVVLKHSHIVSAWAYKRIIEHSQADATLRVTHPVQVTRDAAFYAPKQIREHMLCGNCEHMFGVREQYVEAITRPTESLPLLSTILDPARKPLGAGYTFARAGRLDIRKMTYFALSVFWRAHEASVVPECELGAQTAEALRLHLLSAVALPPSLSLQVVFFETADIDYPGLSIGFTMPTKSHEDTHAFEVGGVLYRLAERPDVIEVDLCTLRAVDVGLCIGPTSVFVSKDEWMKNATAKGELRKQWANPTAR